jgi:hypothetical protein
MGKEVATCLFFFFFFLILNPIYIPLKSCDKARSLVSTLHEKQ